MSILERSKAVRTPVLPEVLDVVSKVPVDFDSVKQYKTNIVQWLKPIIDLKDYYVYPTNGITQGLDWWMSNEQKSIWMEDGDYQWVQQSGSMYSDSIKYISTPSAIDGNYRPIPTYTPSVLDLAYVGSTAICAPLEINNNVETVFYSLSKPFGIRNIRTGWMFTKTPDPRMDALTHSAKYYNYYANDIAESIISNFDVDYIHNTLRNHQQSVCATLDFVPSDSVWLATTTDPVYDKFKRGDCNRVCIAEEVSAAYSQSARTH